MKITYKRASAVREKSTGYSRPKNNPKIISAEGAYKQLSEYTHCDREHFVAITLSGASRIINTRVISIGTVNQSLVHPREVFRDAIADNAVGIILAHNHPSGQLEASHEDKMVTIRLKKAGELLGIEILDHLIITKEGFYSFREENLL